MEQPQRLFHRRKHVLPLRRQPPALSKGGLLELNVPVAELIPEKVIDIADGLVITELFDVRVDAFRRLFEPRKDPAVGKWDLAVGAGEPRAIIVDGEVKAATVMTVTLSCDHRAIDGALGATLLTAFKSFIEYPPAMLL